MVLIQKPGDVKTSEITPESYYRQRRAFLRALAASAVYMVAPRLASAEMEKLQTADILTPFDAITQYNNYYEFSTNKKAVVHLAKALTLRPWTIQIVGEVEKPVTLDVDVLLKRFTQVERVYRLRCVEGWSMVIPWMGFPLSELLAQTRPTSNARYVEFISLHRPSEMIGQRLSGFPWPYREGLRIDEAMHPLTLVATGLYGKSLPPQNGAPLRIVVPWKYGFKSPKAITHIRLTAEQPNTSWSQSAPSEYGFYANVNPHVPHPRWSQARENRIGELRKRPTLLFNGYAEDVAHMYRGMDLVKHF